MATFYIREYTRCAIDGRGQILPVGEEPGFDQTPISITGGSLPSATLRGGTRFVRLHTDAICSFVLGANPTATTSNARMAANQTEFFGVSQDGLKIAVIANS